MTGRGAIFHFIGIKEDKLPDSVDMTYVTKQLSHCKYLYYCLFLVLSVYYKVKETVCALMLCFFVSTMTFCT